MREEVDKYLIILEILAAILKKSKRHNNRNRNSNKRIRDNSICISYVNGVGNNVKIMPGSSRVPVLVFS